MWILSGVLFVCLFVFFLEKGYICQRENSVEYGEFLCDFLIRKGRAVCMQGILFHLLPSILYSSLCEIAAYVSNQLTVSFAVGLIS